jgi:hypothetical protein
VVSIAALISTPGARAAATAASEPPACFGEAAELGSEQCTGSIAVQREPPASTDHILLQLGGRASVAEQSAKQASEASGTFCQGMHDVEKQCSKDGCRVLATNMRGNSCASYCANSGHVCVGAWEEVEENCEIKYALTCEDSSVPTSDLICQCAPSSTIAQPPAASVPLQTFFWNVHWECSLSARGAKATCKHRIGRRFAQLALEAKAEVVASVELSDGNSKPASLSSFGLPGWTQVDGLCKHGNGGDAAALAFAPTWRVEKSGGGCLRTDYDTRAFAVARVVPPQPVQGCPRLCIIAIHAPHSYINKGKATVQRVCGEAASRCGVAMGDWNVPARNVGRLWSQLIGGRVPGAAVPDVRTCCFPESHHYGVFDHLATNIQGARHDGHKVYPYQLLSENPVKQHRAVAARLILPGGVAHA